MRWSAAFSARGLFCAMEARNWLRLSTSSPARFISVSSDPTLTRMVSSTTGGGARRLRKARAALGGRGGWSSTGSGWAAHRRGGRRPRLKLKRRRLGPLAPQLDGRRGRRESSPRPVVARFERGRQSILTLSRLCRNRQPISPGFNAVARIRRRGNWFPMASSSVPTA